MIPSEARVQDKHSLCVQEGLTECCKSIRATNRLHRLENRTPKSQKSRGWLRRIDAAVHGLKGIFSVTLGLLPGNLNCVRVLLPPVILLVLPLESLALELWNE